MWKVVTYNKFFKQWMLCEGTVDAYKYTRIFQNKFWAMLYSKLHHVRVSP